MEADGNIEATIRHIDFAGIADEPGTAGAECKSDAERMIRLWDPAFVPLEGESHSHAAFKAWPVQLTSQAQRPEYVPNPTPLDGRTTAREAYKAWPVERRAQPPPAAGGGGGGAAMRARAAAEERQWAEFVQRSRPQGAPGIRERDVPWPASTAEVAWLATSCSAASPRKPAELRAARVGPRGEPSPSSSRSELTM